MIKVRYRVDDFYNDNDLLPEYKTEGASGADLKSAIDATIYPGDRLEIPTGLSLQIPEGYEGQIRPRSGLAAKNGIIAFPGTIDSDYRGEVCVILFSLSSIFINSFSFCTPQIFEIKKGDRIAQIVFAPVVRAFFEPADLDGTVRNEAGFGSTGI